MADSEEYPGPYCMKNGISTDWLISLLSNSKDGPDQPNVPDFNDPVKISLPVSDDPENETCPVCLGGCENKSYIKDCMHYFCFACIRQWSLMVETCPVCKVKVTSILHSASSPVEYQELTLSGNSETGKHLCQGVILEMLNLMERNNLTWQSMMIWFKYYYGVNFHELCPSVQAITSRVKNLQKKVQKLSRDRKKTDIEVMKSLPFDLPESRKSESFQEDLKRKNTESVLKVNFKESSVSHTLYASTISACNSLANELCEVKESLTTEQEKKEKFKAKCESQKSVCRNLTRQLKRRSVALDRQKEEKKTLEKEVAIKNKEISKLRKELDSKGEKIENYKTKVSEIRKEKKNVQELNGYHRKRNSDLKNVHPIGDDGNSALSTKLRECNDIIVEKDDVLNQLSERVDELEAMQTSQPAVVTFENGRYTDDVRVTCLDLLSRNVGIQNVEPIIRSVSSNIFKAELGRLPGTSKLAEMLVEARTVSHLQLAEQIPKEQFNTLHTDGTTKFGHKYGSYQVSTETSCYTLGLADMQSGSAAQTLEVLKQVLSDIGKAAEQHGKNGTPSRILTSIKNTMSDRHIVEKNFNELLQTYRAECLPGVTANWQHLTEKEQLEVAKMNNFFCGMHFMVAMADQADKTLKEWEKVQFAAEKVGAAALPGNATGSESGTIRLVRTMCKAMEKHGSEQVGCSLPFSEYLKTQGIKKVPLSSFKGNRFNIVFHNAAGVYFLNEHATVFLESIYGTGNRLLQAVLADVKVKEYVAATRALGVINKMITVPLWRVIEDKTLGILDMNAKYTSMRDSLKAWSEDASALLTGEVYLFNDTLINRDVVYEKLVEQCTDDSITVEVLQLMFKSFYLTMERMLKDHLPQGVHDKPSAIKISETKSTPKSNVVSERDFAQLDRLLREKPNATTIALEGMILYANNKTRSWLDRKNAEEKSEILKIATKLTPAYKKLFNQRREAIRQHVAQTLKEKQDDIERKKLKAQQQKEKLVNAISADGLWQTADAVEASMLCYPSVSRKIVALKQQINFRKIVLLQEVGDKSLFSFSKDKKQHSLDQLKQNLLRLISETQHVTEPSAKCGRAQGGQEDPVMQNPQLLVGKRVVHYFEEDGTRQGYFGVVIGLVPGTRTWFNISYDEEGDDEIHTFELLDDYRDGDLEILYS